MRRSSSRIRKYSEKKNIRKTYFLKFEHSLTQIQSVRVNCVAQSAVCDQNMASFVELLFKFEIYKTQKYTIIKTPYIKMELFQSLCTIFRPFFVKRHVLSIVVRANLHVFAWGGEVLVNVMKRGEQYLPGPIVFFLDIFPNIFIYVE